eukprot:scaffold4691_cov62-Phaeocystis_antarctica.AAC.3
MLRTIVQPDIMGSLRPCQSAPWRPLSSSTSSAVRQALSEVRAADSGEGQRGRWALAVAVYWTSSNLQGCIVSRRGVSRTPFTSDSGCQSHFDGKPQRLPKACQMASRTQTEDGSLLRVPQEVPAAHMTASLGPPGSHLVRVAGWHLELAVGGQVLDEDFTASGRPPIGGWRRPRPTI